jgi:hypothetical protein
MKADSRWLAKAAGLTPALHITARRPVAEVRCVREAKFWQGWRCEALGPALPDRALGRGDSMTVDFGEHVVGRLRLRFTMDGRCWDAPARVRIVAAEVPLELGEPWEP